MALQIQIAIGEADVLYERAFSEHWSDVFRFLLACTNDWTAAEDLTREAFLRLWKSRMSIDWSQSVLPWLFVAGRRLATDRFRALSRRVFPHSVPVAIDDSFRAQWLDVQSALGTLSALERAATVLTTFQGLSTAEAADLLRTSPGAVRSAISRARIKLEKAR